VTGRAFVDTNVWVYAVDTSDKAKQARAIEVIERETRRGLVVSAQVMSEYYVTTTRKLQTPLAPEAALEDVRDMMRQSVVALDARLVEAAIVGAQAWGLSYWDAMLVVAARTAGAGRLLSEDLQDGRVIDGVTIENPFRELGAHGEVP
jgi:predicted nucleic acid-binding protein